MQTDAMPHRPTNMSIRRRKDRRADCSLRDEPAELNTGTPHPLAHALPWPHAPTTRTAPTTNKRPVQKLPRHFNEVQFFLQIVLTY